MQHDSIRNRGLVDDDSRKASSPTAINGDDHRPGREPGDSPERCRALERSAGAVATGEACREDALFQCCRGAAGPVDAGEDDLQLPALDGAVDLMPGECVEQLRTRDEALLPSGEGCDCCEVHADTDVRRARIEQVSRTRHLRRFCDTCWAVPKTKCR